MKLSELSWDEATAVMVKLAGPFDEICDDDDAVALIEEYKTRYNKPYFYAMGKLIPGLVRHLLVKHSKALVDIVSVLTEHPAKDIGKMNFSQIVGELEASYDDVLATFIKPSGKQTKGVDAK